MLTEKQIKELPIGDYPNWRLMQMFPKQQGAGKSAKVQRFKQEKDGKESFFEALVNQFTGKFIRSDKHQKKIVKSYKG